MVSCSCRCALRGSDPGGHSGAAQATCRLAATAPAEVGVAGGLGTLTAAGVMGAVYYDEVNATDAATAVKNKTEGDVVIRCPELV